MAPHYGTVVFGAVLISLLCFMFFVRLLILPLFKKPTFFHSGSPVETVSTLDDGDANAEYKPSSLKVLYK